MEKDNVFTELVNVILALPALIVTLSIVSMYPRPPLEYAMVENALVQIHANVLQDIPEYLVNLFHALESMPIILLMFVQEKENVLGQTPANAPQVTTVPLAVLPSVTEYPQIH